MMKDDTEGFFFSFNQLFHLLLMVIIMVVIFPCSGSGVQMWLLDYFLFFTWAESPFIYFFTTSITRIAMP